MKNRMKKAGGFSLLIIACMVAMMPIAHAYIDPSATTYLLQAVAGIVIAAGSVAMIFWRRAKKKLKEKAGIDFDRNKETEEDVIAVNQEEEKR